MTTVGVVTFVLVLLSTVALAVVARPRRASAVDFYLAGRRIGTLTNAFAICGDYFSAASFLGVAAAVYATGLDGAWYATGFAAGFVPVVLLIAAPLRRFGHLSLPDFLARRLDSRSLRVTAVVVVQLVILSYLVPQAIASGITWSLVVDVGLPGLDPYDTGVVVAGVLICGLVSLGGMRATTWAQAVQFLFLFLVLAWLAVVVATAGFSYSGALQTAGAAPLANPVPGPGGWELQPVDHGFLAGETARFDRPGGRYDLASQFALVFTLVLGTAGLPHVMNRYFTAPTGRAARYTTVWVLGGAGAFYFLAVMLGVAARSMISRAPPEDWLAELTTGGVLQVPEHALLVLGRLHAGEVGFGIVAIAALVAVLSTMGGLLLAAATSWGHDIFQQVLAPRSSPARALRAGRIAVAGTAVVASACALPLQPETLSASFPSIVATMVTWAFALAGSTLTPMLVLAIWWRRTTAAGVTAGLIAGAVTAIGLFAVGLGTDPDLPLLSTPTPVAAAVALAVAVAVSRRTRPPADLDEVWCRLHGTAADRSAERLARLTIRGVGF